MIKVLFVCADNVCSSPMAEAVFQYLVDNAGLSDQIEADSAGTRDWRVGEPIHRGVRTVLGDHSIPYTGQARPFRRADLDKFNYILAMDRSNLSDVWNVIVGDEYPLSHIVEYAGHKVEVRPFLHYAYSAGLVNDMEVPDPSYLEDFEPVYQLVRIGCSVLLDYLRRTHNL